MLSQEHSLEVLYRAQSELIREFREIFGQRYTYPDQVIYQITNRIYRSYMQYGLKIYSDPGNQPTHQGDGAGYTYVLRLDPSQPNCHHYLYLHVGVEYDNVGSWVINTVSVQCRKIPGDLQGDNTLNDNIEDVRHLVEKIHRRTIVQAKRSHIDQVAFFQTGYYLDVLTDSIVNIWTILKWHEPLMERSEFIRHILASVLHLEHHRKVKFLEVNGELVVCFYYKNERVLSHIVQLPRTYDELL